MTPRPRRILVVDDDPTLRDTLREVLTETGYHVRDAGDGREALERLDGWQPDLVVLDLMLPVMDAYAFHEALERAGRQIPLLVVSAAPRLAEAAERLGAAGAVSKPFRIAALHAQIDRILADPAR